MRITFDGETLRWHGFGLDLPMAHRHYDLFEIAAEPTAWFENKTVQFTTGVEGDIESLMVPLEPAVRRSHSGACRSRRWPPVRSCSH